MVKSPHVVDVYDFVGGAVLGRCYFCRRNVWQGHVLVTYDLGLVVLSVEMRYQGTRKHELELLLSHSFCRHSFLH